MHIWKKLLLISLGLIAICTGIPGCSDSGQPGDDAGVDGGSGDSGVPDSGIDGGLPPDGGNPDGGAMDSGFDGGVDSGIADAGTDGGADAEVTDAGADSGADAGVDGGGSGDGGSTYCLTSQCFGVPPTGQTKCYNNGDADGGGVIPCPSNRTDPFWGQDPQFPKVRTLTCSGGACSTSAAAEGEVVTDSLTGLVWQRTFVAGKTWLQALDYCDALSYGGHGDWRLPNPFEMASIFDNQKFKPAVDTAKFPGTPSEVFWTSVSTASNTDIAWTGSFWDGQVYNGTLKSYAINARCIRSGTTGVAPSSRYIETEPKAGEKIVTDTVTGLIWQYIQTPDKTWSDALSYCALLDYGNYQDWRLPNKNELMSLADYLLFNPATDFPGASTGGCWSSSTGPEDSLSAWMVGFYHSYVLYSLKSYTDYVRCVRGGP